MFSIIEVFVGGIVGTFLRYLIGITVSTLWMLVIVNIIGSFLLGLFTKYYEKSSSTKWKLFFTTGMLGSFTTFSSFSQQWFELLHDDIFFGGIYGIGMCIVCVCTCFLGYKILR